MSVFSIETEGDLKAGDALKLDLIVQFDHDVHIDTVVLKNVIYRAIHDFYRSKNNLKEFDFDDGKCD